LSYRGTWRNGIGESRLSARSKPIGAVRGVQGAEAVTRIEVAAIRKADGAEVRVTVQGYKGRRVVDVRVWYQPAAGGDFVPTRKGITVDADKLPALAEAIASAMRLTDAG
jgi:hypothetical protein